MSEKNRLSRLSFAREHVSVSIDKRKCVVLERIENLWAELSSLTKDRKSKNEIEFFEVVKNGLQTTTEEFLLQLIESKPLR